MTFLERVKGSFFNKTFYSEVLLQPVFSAISYFLLLSVFIAMIHGAFLFRPMVILLPQNIHDVLTNFASNYPPQLVISLQDGILNTNTDEPFIVAMPWLEKSDTPYQNLLVIDTTTPYSSQAFEQYSSIVWFTKDSVFIKSDSGIRTESLRKFPDVVIDSSMISKTIEKFRPFLSYFSFVLWLFIILFMYFFALARFAYIGIVALFLWIVGRLLHFTVSYRNLYVFGVYAMTPAIFITLVYEKIGGLIHLGAVPFLFSMLVLVMYVYCFPFEKNSVPLPRKKMARHKKK